MNPSICVTYNGSLGQVIFRNIHSFKLLWSEVSRSEFSRSEVLRSAFSREPQNLPSIATRYEDLPVNKLLNTNSISFFNLFINNAVSE